MAKRETERSGRDQHRGGDRAKGTQPVKKQESRWGVGRARWGCWGKMGEGEEMEREPGRGVTEAGE